MEVEAVNDHIRDCSCFSCVKDAEDVVNFPSHYMKGKFEAIDVMEDWFSDDPLLFTALKYLARCKHKGNLVQDLRKAIWYIERRITKEEENGN